MNLDIKSKKVCVFITQFYQVSGAEKLALELAVELLRRDYDVELLSMYSREGSHVIHAEKRLKERGINNISYLNCPLNPTLKDIIRASVRLRKHIKRKNISVIETSFLGPMTLACLSSFLLPVVILGGIHAVFDRKSNNTTKHRIWRLATRYGNSPRFYAISDAVKYAWSEFSSTPKGSIATIYNSISEEFYSSERNKQILSSELGIKANSTLILFVGSIVEYKGLDKLISATHKELHKDSFHLLVVGEAFKADSLLPGDSNYYDTLKSMIQSLDISSKVHFLGHRNDVAAIMSSCDLLVHPTRTEGFGLVIAEAMATGLPVVATNVGGIPEVVANTNSKLVDPGDENALLKAILASLNETKEKKEETISLGKKRARQFGTTNRVDELLSLANI